jgi:hypothetical protein
MHVLHQMTEHQETYMTDRLYTHTTLDRTVQLIYTSSATGYIITSQGKTSRNRQDAGDLFELQDTPTNVICIRISIICNQQSSHVQTTAQHIGQTGAKKELTRMAGDKKNIKRKVKPKRSTSYNYHRDKDKLLHSCAREKVASKSTSLWGGKRCQVLKCLK